MALLVGAIWSASALADEPILTKAPTVSAPAASTNCQDLPDFFLGTCQLAYYGVRFYGVIDVGGGYQTHGAPWDPYFPQGSSYLVQKMNREFDVDSGAERIEPLKHRRPARRAVCSGLEICRTARSRLRPIFAEFLERPAIDCQQQGRAARPSNRQQRFEPRRPILQFDGLPWSYLRRTRHAHLFPSKLLYAGRRFCLRPDGGLLCFLGAGIFQF